MNQALKIHHHLADVVLKPGSGVNTARLKKLIRTTLDQYRLLAGLTQSELMK